MKESSKSQEPKIKHKQIYHQTYIKVNLRLNNSNQIYLNSITQFIQEASFTKTKTRSKAQDVIQSRKYFINPVVN